MGRVSLYEDISDRLNADAINVASARGKLSSIKHLPDGSTARQPKLRSDIAVLWQDFEGKIQALQTCNQRQIRTDPRKRLDALIDRAAEGSWLRDEMNESLAKLIDAYPVRHPNRIILERGLSQI